MWRATNGVKCCANCANWTGERKAEFGTAITAGAAEKAKCYCGYHSTSEGTSACGTNCNGKDFQLWGALRR